MRAMGLRSSPIAAPRASGCARRNTRRRRVQALRSLGSQAGGADGSGACPLGDAPPRDVQAAAATPSSTASPDAEPLASASASSCPYSAAKGAAEEVVDAVGKTARLAAARARKLPRVDLDSATFLQSVIKAATDPAGMAGAMLDWSDEHGMTVGIDNPIGPACVATVDPEVRTACGISRARTRHASPFGVVEHVRHGTRAVRVWWNTFESRPAAPDPNPAQAGNQKPSFHSN